MTQKAYPLNDTLYTAEDVRLFHVARSSGIFNVTGNDLQVNASSGMNVTVSKGYAFLLTHANGAGGVTYGSDAVETLKVEIASTTDRYDYVSVKYSKTTNEVKLTYVKGSGTRPSEPVRNANEYEIILAIIKVRANSAEIKGSDIEDCRLNPKYCGLVIDGTERIPTEGFRSYMDSVKDTLNKDTAGNLLNKINANSNEIKQVKTDATSLTERVLTLENNDFKYAYGTEEPTTVNCPEGSFYFQIEV